MELMARPQTTRLVRDKLSSYPICTAATLRKRLYKIMLSVLVLLALSPEVACAEEPITSDPIPVSATLPANSSTPTVKEKLPQSFPRLHEFGGAGAPVSGYSPVEQNATPWYFALLRLSVVIVAVSLSLRATRLWALQAEQQEDYSPKWIARRCLLGLTGIIVALLLPAYAIGACIVVVTSIVPLWPYLRVQGDPAIVPLLPASGPQTVGQPVERKGPGYKVQVEFLSGKSIGSTESRIRLISKSSLAQNTDLGFSRGVTGAPAFQHALALIDHAVGCRGTDIHISAKPNSFDIRLRIDGSLIKLGELSRELGSSITNVFKVMSDLNIADRRRSQDGSFLADVNDKRLSFRVSAHGTQTGEALSIRILDPAKSFCDLNSIGMPEQMRTRYSSLLARKNGLILIVGTTGAGKSTTACASLQCIDSESRAIVSIEDPIEYQIPDVDQIVLRSNPLYSAG